MEDTRKTADTLAKEAERARERVQDIADNAWEKGREKVEELRERGEEALTDLQEQGEDVWAQTQSLVKKYPARAIGISLLAGAVIGLLLSNRSDD